MESSRRGCSREEAARVVRSTRAESHPLRPDGHGPRRDVTDLDQRPERNAPVWCYRPCGSSGVSALISPMLGPSCRFYPSCSHYALTCLCEHGLVRGLWLSARRVARCHPFHPGGFDPPPPPAGRRRPPCATPKTSEGASRPPPPPNHGPRRRQFHQAHAAVAALSAIVVGWNLVFPPPMPAPEEVVPRRKRRRPARPTVCLAARANAPRRPRCPGLSDATADSWETSSPST